MSKLEQYCKAKISLEKARAACLKELGMTYTSLKKLEKEVIGDIPDTGLAVDGMRILPVKTPVYLRRLGEKQVFETTRVIVTEDK